MVYCALLVYLADYNTPRDYFAATSHRLHNTGWPHTTPSSHRSSIVSGTASLISLHRMTPSVTLRNKELTSSVERGNRYERDLSPPNFLLMWLTKAVHSSTAKEWTVLSFFCCIIDFACGKSVVATRAWVVWVLLYAIIAGGPRLRCGIMWHGVGWERVGHGVWWCGGVVCGEVGLSWAGLGGTGWIPAK